jgi:hypothetical protein
VPATYSLIALQDYSNCAGVIKSIQNRSGFVEAKSHHRLRDNAGALGLSGKELRVLLSHFETGII